MENEVIAPEVVGTKEIDELIAGVVVLVKTGFAVAKDKKVSIADLAHLIALLEKMPVLVASVEGADKIPAEVEALTLEEAQALILKVVGAIAEVKAA